MKKKAESDVNSLPPNLQQLVDEYQREASIVRDYHTLRSTFIGERWQDPLQPPIRVIQGQAPERTVRQACQKLARQATQWLVAQGLAYLSAVNPELDHADKEAAAFIDATYVVCEQGQSTKPETNQDDRNHLLHKRTGQKKAERPGSEYNARRR